MSDILTRLALSAAVIILAGTLLVGWTFLVMGILLCIPVFAALRAIRDLRDLAKLDKFKED